mgnify:CR=1 FL=1
MGRSIYPEPVEGEPTDIRHLKAFLSFFPERRLMGVGRNKNLIKLMICVLLIIGREQKNTEETKMKQTVEKKTLYLCSKCKTRYPNKKDAARCEKRTREKKTFRVGDKIQNIEPRTCQIKQRNYIFSGRVLRILGPKPSDYEYEVKWLGGEKERINGHVFQYEIEFNCPRCGEKRQERYYAPELKATCR